MKTLIISLIFMIILYVWHKLSGGFKFEDDQDE